MKNSIIVEKSETGDEVYFRLNHGTVSHTVEITNSMYADLDSKGTLLGVEWINIKECTKDAHLGNRDYSTVPEIKALHQKHPDTSVKIEKLLSGIL